LAQAFPPTTGSKTWIDKTNLRQHGCLVPVDPLAGYLTVLELDHRHYRHLDVLASGRDAGEYPRHFDGVSEAEGHFVSLLVPQPLVKDAEARSRA
jgi:hypothetical protein